MNYQANYFEVEEDYELLAYIKGDYINAGENYFKITDMLISYLHIDFSELQRLIDEEFDNIDFEDNFNIFISQHPYLEMFPIELEYDIDDYDAYCNYLIGLQNLFYRIFHFCFDQNIYFDELGHLTAIQRLHIYTKIKGGEIPQELRQINLLNGDVLLDFHEQPQKEQSPLESLFSIPAGFVEYIAGREVKMSSQYLLKSTTDALTLEFYEMVNRNLKLKKCKNCGRYFEVKTKRNPDYCDFAIDGGTQTCQQIIATRNFKAKHKDNAAYKIFNLYYKRYHERKKVGTIKVAIFDKWNRQAGVMRDECIDGKRDLAEFEEWCYDSFPNRARKPRTQQ